MTREVSEHPAGVSTSGTRRHWLGLSLSCRQERGLGRAFNCFFSRREEGAPCPEQGALLSCRRACWRNGNREVSSTRSSLSNTPKSLQHAQGGELICLVDHWSFMRGPRLSPTRPPSSLIPMSESFFLLSTEGRCCMARC